ncbi:MAG: hypothetical protein AB1505_21360, partial [Candidatus Latescibacterota bacterium]
MLARGVLVFAVACVVYAGSAGNAFHYDDFHSVVHNPHLRSLSNVPRFFADPALFSVDPQQAMYRPVLLVSFAVGRAVYGDSPRGYHLTSVLLHGANAVLWLLLLAGLGQRGPVPLLASLVFAVVPLNSEAVCYVSSRSELLMAAFLLLACLAHMRAWPGRSPAWEGAGVLAAALAVLTKEVAVVGPVCLALCDRAAGGWPRVRRRWRTYLLYGAVSLTFAALGRELIGKALATPTRGLDVQAWTQVKAGAYYLLLAGWPARLSVEHQFFPAVHPAEPAVLASLLLLSSLAFVVCRPGGGTLRFGAAWAALLVLP